MKPGFVSTSYAQLDADGAIETHSVFIPGSGILAIAPAGSSANVGNIAVQALQGSIEASAGGIMQVAFNNQENRGASIQLNAGQDINARIPESSVPTFACRRAAMSRDSLWALATSR